MIAPATVIAIAGRASQKRNFEPRVLATAAVASWLTPDERQWLSAVMAEEQRQVDAGRRVSVWQSLIDRRVLALGLIHFAQAGVSVSISVFVAQMIK
jgi:hypothetical protein